MDIPIDLLYIVASFHTKPRMKLLDWVDIDKLDWYTLSENPNATYILEKHFNKINWDWLSENPNAIHLLEKHPEKINWSGLSMNPSIFEIDIKQTHIHMKKKANKINVYLQC